MNFGKREASLIKRGKQTLLLVTAKRDRDTKRYRPPHNYRIGNDLAVQPAPKAEEVCRIVVTGVSLRALNDLDFVAARNLGFRTRAEFAADWMNRHDHDWPELEPVICPECDGHAVNPDGDECPNCEYGEAQEPRRLSDEEILERFRARHGHTQVWVVSFVVPPELPRLLASHSEKGYTTKPFEAIPGEPEAVDEVTLARYARENRAKDEARTDRTLSQRLAAIEGDPNVRRQLTAIERRIKAAELVKARKGRAA